MGVGVGEGEGVEVGEGEGGREVFSGHLLHAPHR